MAHRGQADPREVRRQQGVGASLQRNRGDRPCDQPVDPGKITSIHNRHRPLTLEGLHAPGAQLLSWALRAGPELLALICCLLRNQPALLALPLAVLLRSAWILAELGHGAGHSLARCVVDRDPQAFRWLHIREHRSSADLLRLLRPFAPLLTLGQPPAAAVDPPGRDPHRPLGWLASGDLTPWKVRTKACAGLLANGLVMLGAGILLQSPGLSNASQGSAEAIELLGLLDGGASVAASSAVAMALWCLLVANGLVLLLSRSDFQSLLTGEGAFLWCGNFGLITVPARNRAGDLLPKELLEIYQLMGRETEVRGSQAGGGLVLSQDRAGQPLFIGHKLVNAKRGDLTQALETGFWRRRRLARFRGVRPHHRTLLACWHYRFGTSGPPAVQETHWLEWTPAQTRRLYRQHQGRWIAEQRLVQHRITHNGDFEAIQLGGVEVEVFPTLGPWLEQVLNQPAPGVVDSARIAAMMDLMICQGDWLAAVRWGYLCACRSYPEPPPPGLIEHCSHMFESAFAKLVEPEAAEAGEPNSWVAPLRQQMLTLLQADPATADQPTPALRAWIDVAIEAFLHLNPAKAVQQFMERARGSFGLVVVSTCQPDQLVLSSLGQPISIAMEWQTSLAIYASEPAAVDAVMTPRQRGWRLDLDQNAGEIAVLRPNSLDLFSLSLERPLSAEEWQNRRLFYGDTPQAKPPAHILRLPLSRRSFQDPIASDLADIPGLLNRIHADWANPGSPNRQSAEALANFLITKANNVAAKERALQQAGLDPSLAKSSQADLLITGMENSLWIGHQFACDLMLLYPQLNVQVASANTMLARLQNDIESLGLARQSLVLILSHSGQTFPSRQVMEACDVLVRHAVIREFFVMVGEADSLLGSPLLDGHRPGEAFSRRLFTTAAQRRRAEPATITAVAMQHSLTELLLCISRQLLQAFPEGGITPLGLRLERQQLWRMQDKESAALLQDCCQILGRDQQGEAQPSSTSRQLLRAGRRWGQHVKETATAWILHAIYILVSVEFHLPLVQTTTGLLLKLSGVTLSLANQELWHHSAKFCDVAVYIFGAWLWTLLLRLLQGRPLLARTGRRTVVIGESPLLHQLLSNYVSKLFALSYGIASVDVQGDHAADQLLHTQAHRVVRGTLLFLGIPDGRSGLLQGSQAKAVMLAGRQSDGIRHLGTGPEIIAVGTDPAIKAGPFQQAIVIPDNAQAAAAGPAIGRSSQVLESLRESRYGSLRRLLAGYVLFWAMARHVGRLPLLRFAWWRSQSRTRIMTTAAPISAAQLDLAEPREVEALALKSVANRDQS